MSTRIYHTQIYYEGNVILVLLNTKSDFATITANAYLYRTEYLKLNYRIHLMVDQFFYFQCNNVSLVFLFCSFLLLKSMIRIQIVDSMPDLKLNERKVLVKFNEFKLVF